MASSFEMALDQAQTQSYEELPRLLPRWLQLSIIVADKTRVGEPNYNKFLDLTPDRDPDKLKSLEFQKETIDDVEKDFIRIQSYLSKASIADDAPEELSTEWKKVHHKLSALVNEQLQNEKPDKLLQRITQKKTMLEELNIYGYSSKDRRKDVDDLANLDAGALQLHLYLMKIKYLVEQNRQRLNDEKKAKEWREETTKNAETAKAAAEQAYRRSSDAETTASKAKTAAKEANQQSARAHSTAIEAKTTASEAKTAAKEAKQQAARAHSTATEANTTASEAKTAATEATTAAKEAKQTASEAKQESAKADLKASEAHKAIAEFAAKTEKRFECVEREMAAVSRKVDSHDSQIEDMKLLQKQGIEISNAAAKRSEEAMTAVKSMAKSIERFVQRQPINRTQTHVEQGQQVGSPVVAWDTLQEAANSATRGKIICISD